jgi:hypothetical protein
VEECRNEGEIDDEVPDVMCCHRYVLSKKFPPIRAWLQLSLAGIATVHAPGLEQGLRSGEWIIEPVLSPFSSCWQPGRRLPLLQFFCSAKQKSIVVGRWIRSTL